MFRKTSLALLAGASCFAFVTQSGARELRAEFTDQPVVIRADQAVPQQPAPQQVAYGERSNMGGGFIEFLFGDASQAPRYRQQSYDQRPIYAPQPEQYQPPQYQQAQPQYRQEYQQSEPQPQMDRQQVMREQDASEAAHPAFDPKFEKQTVDYHGKEAAGTIVIDTSSKFLFLVQGDGKALRYGVGVGKPGFLWAGVKTVTAKKEWPDWTPPAEMLVRRPDLPRHMEGGPQNPLGARAMYLGSSLYRIHGSNEPWTIGTNVSSGCIRMRNQDVIDLYGRVHVGAKVVVI
ncbi:MAG: L,D-transpeptidase [Proteobacteria bacterium]|nr:L,D-transpeptidase [Pseudomonadota bacterium]